MRALRAKMVGLSLLAAGALLLAACGTSGPKTSTGTTAAHGAKEAGGTVTFAEAPGGKPDSIFPVSNPTYSSTYNDSQFSNLLYPPLLALGLDGKSELNPAESIADPPVYSNGDKTVTITLKNWDWSDGTPISSRDLTFFFNLVKANKAQWAQYSPGLFPDNVKSMTATGPKTVVLQLSQAYNPTFFNDNQLQLIIPLPQQVWDKTSATSPDGNYDETTAGAVKVWNYLQAQGADTSTFTTSALWKVVDGPWLLKSYSSTGQTSFVPNPKYSGPSKPTLSTFTELPFTTDGAEFDVLKAGSTLDVGYLPIQDVGQVPALEAEGYKTAQVYQVNVNYIVPNLTQPTVGPILSQLYIRQALEDLVPQDQIVKDIYHGDAIPGNGPTPIKPQSDLVSPLEASGGPYPYNPSKAKSLLSSHGWKVTPNGTDTCQSPGTGASECGAGIAKGEPLSFQLLYASGQSTLDLQNQAIKSSMAQDGITINLKSELFNTVIGVVQPCNPKTPSSQYCSWQLGEYGGISYGTPFPAGNNLFNTGGALNAGSYSSPMANALISATEQQSGTSVYYKYEDYIAEQLPWLWMPIPSGRGFAGLFVYKANLAGIAPVNAFNIADPENWYYTK